MDRNAYSDHNDGEGAGQPDAYWRRRVLTLALGLGLLGVLAWGFSGGGGKTTPSNSPSVLPAAALGTAVPGLPTGAPSGAASGSASGAASASGSGTPTAGATPSPGTAGRSSGARLPAGQRPSVSPSAAPGLPAAAPAGGHCAPGAVVLSLFSDRTSYGPSQYPRFEVYAVSTSAGSCAFDPGQLQVEVLSEGRIVWDSSDCEHSTGRIAELTRGVPAQDSVVWDRAITLPGCQVLAPSARVGDYVVQARTATVQSPARAFKITG